MYRFLTRGSNPIQNGAVLGHHLKSVAPKGKGKGNGKGKKRGAYKAKPWHNWSPLEKEAALQFMRAGLESCRLLWGDEYPRSTLEEWATKFAEQDHISPLGHPRTLQDDENAALVPYFSAILQEGGPMGRETVLLAVAPFFCDC